MDTQEFKIVGQACEPDQDGATLFHPMCRCASALQDLFAQIVRIRSTLGRYRKAQKAVIVGLVFFRAVSRGFAKESSKSFQ
eukprot:1766748-Amphidinium_carterae.2